MVEEKTRQKDAGNAVQSEFRPVPRAHAADSIFEQLAAAILRGELAPNAPLPPERVLGERFNVSRMVLRQAVHRLAEVGLVRVRQGGATIVLDPEEAADIRLIGLYYTLDPGGDRARAMRRDAIEKQFLQGLSLIDVCARRGSSEDKKRVLDLSLAFNENEKGDRKNESKNQKEDAFAAFEEAFWRMVAHAGKNRIFQMEVVWWYGVLAEGRPSTESTASLAVRIGFYRELARRLVEGEGATQYYLAVTSPQLDALFAATSTPLASKKDKRR